jgi:hypothetical protein
MIAPLQDCVLVNAVRKWKMKVRQYLRVSLITDLQSQYETKLNRTR